MRYNIPDLEKEISQLQQRIGEKRREFDMGLRKDREFAELKELFSEIKQMEKRLELCFEESNTQREF